MNEEHDPSAKLSCKEVFTLLEDWRHLVRIDRGGIKYDGKITALSQDAGTLEFSTVRQGEGEHIMVFELADADFERSNNPGGWFLNHEPAEEVFTVFPRSGDWFMLLKWRGTAPRVNSWRAFP